MNIRLDRILCFITLYFSGMFAFSSQCCGDSFSYNFDYVGSELVFPVDRNPYYYPTDRPFDRIEGRVTLISDTQLFAGFDIHSNHTDTPSGGSGTFIPKDMIDFRFTDARFSLNGVVVTKQTADSWSLSLSDPYQVGRPTNYSIIFNHEGSFEDGFFMNLTGYVDGFGFLRGEDVSYYPQRNAYDPGQWSASIQEPHARVLLAVNQQIPLGIKPEVRLENGNSVPYWKVDHSLTTTQATYTETELADLEERVEATFLDAGIFVDVITELDITDPIPDSIVYLGDQLPSVSIGVDTWVLDGKAVDGVDRFNRNVGSAERLMLYRGNRTISDIADTLAHELGHSFGLIHHIGQGIMNHSGGSGFLSEPEIFKQGKGIKSNPTYHLQKWARNRADQGSPVDPELTPGNYDEPDPGDNVAAIRPVFSELIRDITLYSLRVLGGPGGDVVDGPEYESLGDIIEIDSIELSDLPNLLIDLPIFGPITLFASSLPDGNPDIFLHLPGGETLVESDDLDSAFRIDQHFPSGATDVLARGNFQVEAPIPGDYDSDGDIDGADFLIWQRGAVSNPPDSGDLIDWQNNYGSDFPETLSVSIPEATTLSLSFIAIASLLVHRRKR